MSRPSAPPPRPPAPARRGAATVSCLLALAAVALAPSPPARAQPEESPAAMPAAVSEAEGAAARARLAAFTNDIRTFRADFVQTLYDADSKALQSSRGSVVLKRPNRFVWDYVPGSDASAQSIVADGTRLWLYDRELAQVTVSDIDERMAGTPLALLMGGAPLEEAYEVTPLGASDDIEWLELVPKAGGGDFEALYVGLDAAGLAALELRDNFGQATQIRFSSFEPNVDVDDAAFEFEVPEGVDVIGLEE